MKSNSDKTYNKYKDFDFSNAKSAHEIPHLAKLQAQAGRKERITMRINKEVLAVFKEKAEEIDGNYQTLMNDALKQFAQGLTLEAMIRKTIQNSFDIVEKHLLRGNRSKTTLVKKAKAA